MTSSEAIPDFNSNNPISEADFKVTSEQTEESTVTLEDNSVSNQTHVEENSTDTLESVSHQSNGEENSTITPEDDSVSYQTKIEENSVPENVISTPIEQPIEDRESMDTTLLNNRLNPKIQVEIASEKDRLVLILPTVSQTSVSEYSWSE
ncbi:MAG: hypothetical protein AAF915_29135, partial [Cyanobacteria bacterium P01_D01_bin.50]